jgi:hypothetical protein
MEDSDVQIQPDVGRSRIAYLYVVKDVDKGGLSEGDAVALKVEKLKIPEGRVECFISHLSRLRQITLARQLIKLF